MGASTSEATRDKTSAEEKSGDSARERGCSESTGGDEDSSDEEERGEEEEERERKMVGAAEDGDNG